MHSTGLFLIGTKHTIELKLDESDPESTFVKAQCRGAQADFQSGWNFCDWSACFSTYDDAMNTVDARDHADGN
jgi:hypothetical protein